FRGDARRGGPLASHPNEGSLPDSLYVADVLRLASLAIRSVRRGPHGLSSFPLLHRLLLALHARPLRVGIDEPPLDGGPFGCDREPDEERSRGMEQAGGAVGIEFLAGAHLVGAVAERARCVRASCRRRER